jgi:hypothetical protein
MRKVVLAAVAFVLAALVAAPAHAADKLRLERTDLSKMPKMRMFLSLIDRDGRPIPGKQKEEFRLSLDSAEQGPALAVQSFDETKDPINLVILVELSSPVSSVLDDVKRAVGQLADSLPPKSKVALLGYAGGPIRVTEALTSAADVESASKSMQVDADSTEPHLLDAVSTAIDLMAGVDPKQRKLIVIFSDGINVDMDARIFTAKGKRAAEAGIPIDTIGYNEFDPSKLRNLGILAKQSQGSERVCKTATDIGTHFGNITDEIKKQYVATFETNLKDQVKTHDIQVLVGTDNPTYSNIITTKLPPWVQKHSDTGGGWPWWVWLLIVLGIGGIAGLVVWLIFREKPEQMEQPEEAPKQVPIASAEPARPMKTMALDVSAAGGQVAIGWIVATSGKHADQTFKLKPSRTLIGTGADCDVKVEDQFMSSHHCEVRFENGNFKLCDLGSTNGIVVNDKKVREHELVDNDQFRLGRTEFKFKSIT